MEDFGIAKVNIHTGTKQPATLSAWLVPLLASYLEPSLAACDLIGYSCHGAGAYHIILSDEYFHPIRFAFVLGGCSDANLFYSTVGEFVSSGAKSQFWWLTNASDGRLP